MKSPSAARPLKAAMAAPWVALGRMMETGGVYGELLFGQSRVRRHDSKPECSSM